MLTSRKTLNNSEEKKRISIELNNSPLTKSIKSVIKSPEKVRKNYNRRVSKLFGLQEANKIL
jgi:hypothetical protein